MEIETRSISGNLVGYLQGSEQTLLFIHGMWEGSWIFEHWMKYAHSFGYSTWALNLRGHVANGGRSCNLGATCFHEFVHDALSVVDRILDETGKLPVIIGHSMGGLISQQLAQLGKAHKVVLVATAPPAQVKLEGPATKTILMHPFSYLWPMFIGKQFLIKEQDARKLMLNRVENPDEVYERLVPESGKAALEVVGRKIDIAPRLPCPVMVLSGIHDALTPDQVQIKVAKYFDTPFFSQYNNGHMMMLEPGWENPINDILTFVSEAG